MSEDDGDYYSRGDDGQVFRRLCDEDYQRHLHKCPKIMETTRGEINQVNQLNSHIQRVILDDCFIKQCVTPIIMPIVATLKYHRGA